MRGLRAVYLDAKANAKSWGSRNFYEMHHRLIRRFANAYGIPVINACIAFARLSPRTSISLNLRAFINLLDGKSKPNGVLTTNWTSALDALTLSETEAYDYLYAQPLSKVRAFARNLLLDGSVITLDAIMLRLLKDYYPIPSLNDLFRQYPMWHDAVYPVISALDDALSPYQIQAVLWDYARRVYTPIAKDARLL
jgi:hypothetical protein